MAVKDFKLVTVYNSGEPMKTLAKASATVIEAGDMVALSSGLAIKAVAGSAKIAYSPYGAPAGATTVQILNDPEAEFVGTGDANFAVAQRGTEVDLVTNSNAQQIDVGSSTTDVFVISVGDDAGVVDSAANIKVRINKFLY
jgi:hypothetical protein